LSFGQTGDQRICNLKQKTVSWLRNKDTAVGSPIRTPRKIARIGFSFSKASKPDLKSKLMVSICNPYLHKKKPLIVQPLKDKSPRRKLQTTIKINIGQYHFSIISKLQ